MKLTTGMMAIGVSLGMVFNVASSFAGATLDRVMANKVLKIATESAWAPQSFINDKNEMDGFDVDVGKEIGKRLGVKVEFVTPAWDIITAGNWSGRWDISVGSMTPTKERAKVLSFPAVYYYTPASAVVHKNSKATKPSDLNGKVLGACVACTFELYLQQDLTMDAADAPPFTYQIKPGKLKSYENSQPAFDDLRLGDGVRLDGMVDALPAIMGAIKNGYEFKVIGEPLFYEPLAIATDKGDAAFDKKIAEIIKAMKSDGTLATLSKKWYDVDYTSAK